MKKQSLIILAVMASMLLLATISMAQCPHSAKAVDATTTAVPAKAEDNKVVLSVSNMTCGACVSQVTKALSGVDGVDDVTVNLEKGTAEVVFASDKVKPEMLTKAVVKAGYPAKLAAVGDAKAAKSVPNCASTCGSKKKGCDPKACGMKTAAKGDAKAKDGGSK